MRLEHLFKAAAVGIDTARDLAERMLDTLERDRARSNGDGPHADLDDPTEHEVIAHDVESDVVEDAGYQGDETIADEAELVPASGPEASSGGPELSYSIIENSHEAFVGMDGQGRVTAWNPAAETTFGWSSEEAIGQSVAELIIPENLRDDYRDQMSNFLDAGEDSLLGRHLELEGMHKAGRTFPMETTISALEGDDGHTFYAFIRDVSGRRDQDDAKARLAAIVESSEDAVVGMNPDGVITSWNAGAEALFGHSADEMVGESIDLLDEETGESEMRDMLDQVVGGEQVDPIEIHTVTKDGQLIDISTNISLIRGDDDEVMGASMVARDITARRQAERIREIQLQVAAALAESADETEAMPRVLEALGEKLDWEVGSYWSVDPEDGSRLRCSTFWEMEGLELDELGEAFGEAAIGSGEGIPGRVYRTGNHEWVEHGLAAEESSDRIAKAASFGFVCAVAIPLRSDDAVIGAIELLSSEARPPDDDMVAAMSVMAGQVSQFVARKQAERAAEQVKDDFFGLVSHELRTPLTSVIGYTEMLAKSERENLSAKGQKFIEVIRRNAKREMRLVGDLLMLVRIEAGTFELEPGQVDLREIVSESVEASVPAAEKNGVTVSADLGDVAPFKGDPVRLGQAIDNLLSNAIKFNSDGGTVELRMEQKGAEAVIEVADNGDGIPQDEQGRLFDRLYRARSATEDHVPGTGLGLTIVKAIVEAHHGDISLESEAGVGTTFRVTIPLDDREPVAEEPSAVAEGDGQPEPAYAVDPAPNGNGNGNGNGAHPAGDAASAGAQAEGGI